ncbi:U11/U12 small nuclear ribonucleoprotein 35 kDa protein-like [Haliotis rufescens]|uniref:U11/U12 small nuclear ribonucleoprotein 35 kDa protein-like n=1 Tax=Haliotis rufescens TaxID=6454 RepID=UPI001EB05518|nr:U11/U12 small nuclear ribonucleoprotein 35 kDa protein-like [Haliotis rufescens]
MSWRGIADRYDPLKAGSIDGTDTEPHDNGIVRAMNAKYKPNKSVDGDPHRTIFVSGLDRQTEEDTLWTAFRDFGKIKKCRLVRDIVTGYSKGYGFVEFENEKDARAACNHGNKMTVDNREVFVDFECERNMTGWVPRRLGGGIGGNRKSGQLRFGGKDRPFIQPIIPVVYKGVQRSEDMEGSWKEQKLERDHYRGNRDRFDKNCDWSREVDRDRLNCDERRYRDDKGRDYRARDGDYRRERRRPRERSRSRDRERPGRSSPGQGGEEQRGARTDRVVVKIEQDT